MTSAGGNSYQYDANGNQTMRQIGSDTYNLAYDADIVPAGENRLVEVKKNGASIAQFVYDGDGNRVQSTVNGVTTVFVGAHFELTGSTVTKYYFAGATRVATPALAPGASVRKYTIPQSMSVEYILGDHLGSTSLTTDADGAKVSEIRYKPWGEIRYSWTSGQTTTPAYTLPSYTFTGQYSYLDDPSTAGVTEGFGLMFYNARWYDPALGRFVQPDTLIPEQSQGVQAWDRYAYVNNNPVVYDDPSGHCIDGISTWICLGIILIAGTVILSADNPLPEATNFPINASGGIDCSSSLPDCFGDAVELKDFSEYGEDNPIPIEEFEEFADEVAEDLYTHDLTWPGLEAGRGVYDTPFYNGGGSERRGGNPEGVYPADQQVCIETIGCYGRSEINYIAQGMWGAAVNEPKPISIAITWTWKLEEYFQPPSEGTIFWLKYGYDYYKQWLKEHDKK